MMNFLLPAVSLWKREVVRFVRQKGRLTGTFVTPLAFWLLIGTGVGSSFVTGDGEGGGYLAYFYPGALLMMALFTSITATISVIEDRREGFLQGVLVAPAPRAAVALGKMLGATTLGVMQGALFLALAPWAGVPLTWPGALAALGALGLAAFALTGLGFAFAWNMESTQGFHSVMNLLFFPMWLLSGAVFPASGAAPWMQAAMAANPLRYGLALLRRGLHMGGDDATFLAGLPPAGASLALSLAFALAMLAFASWAATRGDSRSAP